MIHQIRLPAMRCAMETEAEKGAAGCVVVADLSAQISDVNCATVIIYGLW